MSWLKNKLKQREQLKDLIQIKVFLENHLKEWINRKKDIPSDIFDATRFILETSIDAYASIHTLYRKEHLKSCVVLGRTILENSINLKYIYTADSDKRARNFVLFPMKPYLERARKTKENISGAEDLISGMEKELETYFPSDHNKNHWDGKSVKRLFDELNLSQFYTEGYVRLSGFAHTSYAGPIDMYTDGPYLNFLRKFIFIDILVVTLEALKMVNEKYDLLEGGMVIKDYPNKGSILLFSVNNKNSHLKP